LSEVFMDAAVVPPIGDSETLEPGSQVGPYVIVRRLGAGGMGQVFLSNDSRLERKVALKRLIPSHLDPLTARARILSEARAAARINHPNIAAVHDVLEHGGRIFIVMEFVEGESLAAYLRREWLPIDRALTIGRQLAAALAAAHAQGVVHRDLKPANIQIMADASVKVLDFGIATAATPVSKLTTSTETVVPPIGAVRGAAGTPEYMSPEQVGGAVVDARSDIFSLGLVLFEMITGRRPFADMSLADRRTAPMRPLPRADSLDPRVPKPVAQLVAKALAVEASARYQSAAELEQAIAALQRQRSAWKRLTLATAAAVVSIPIALTLFGLVTSAAFNVALARPPRFTSEPLSSYLVLGFQSNFALLALTVFLVIVFFGLRFAVRLALTLGPRDAAPGSRPGVFDRLVSRLGIEDPEVLAQFLAMAGLAALVAVYWRFGPFLTAITSAATVASTEQLRPIAADNLSERWLFRSSIDFLLLSFGAGLFWIMKLRGSRQTRGGWGSLVIAGAVVAVFVLLHVAPYRLLYKNKFEKVEVAGERCYLVSEAGGDGFVFCPGAPPPRNRVVRLNDSAVGRTGISESLFTLPAPGGTAAAPRTP
jgi:serine/threonine protein kinase